MVFAHRKLTKYSGDKETYEDWKVEARAAMTAQGVKDKAARGFLLSYLDGPARRELFYAEDEDTDTSEKIFKVLDEAFGETRTAAKLEDGFHSRSQQKGETLREFANALVALVKRAQAKEPNVFPDKENVLKDRFARKVTHKGLRRALIDKVAQEPDMTFRALRKYATGWMEEEEPSRALSQEVETEIDEKRFYPTKTRRRE